MADRGPKTGRMPLAQAGLIVATVLFIGAVGGVGGWLALGGDATPAAAHADAGGTDGHAAETGKEADDGHAPADDHGAAPKADGDHDAAAHASDTQAPDAKADGTPAGTGHDSANDGEPAHAEPAHATDDHASSPADSGHAAPAHADTPGPASGDDHAAAPQATADSHAAGADDDGRKLAMAPSARAPTPKPPPALAAQDRKPLAPAPDPAITSNGRYGPLPIRSPDGRLPWQVYSRPFAADIGVPRIAIVVTHLGLAEQPTLSATRDLPGEITLAFSPYSSRLAEWVPAARAAGHDVLLQLPMEPRSTEFNDPGNKALLTANTPEVN